MEDSAIKSKILGTQVNKLGLGKRVNSWFFVPELQMKQEEVITLRELFTLNSTFSPRYHWLTTFNPRTEDDISKRYGYRGLTTSNRSWETLRDFLLENNFDHTDWIQLLPYKKETDRYPDFSLLEKDRLLLLNIHDVSDMKKRGSSIRAVEFILEKKNPTYYDIHEYLTIKETLAFTKEDVDIMLQHCNSVARKTLRTTLHGVQKKLKLYGLTEKDGTFMELRFVELKSEADFIKELVNNNHCSLQEASLVVTTAKSAGWIEVA